MLILLAMVDDESDKALFRRIYERYRHKMYAVAMNILHSPAQAEDAVHDAFVKMIKHFDTLKQIPGNETEAWIVIIVKNTALDALRKEERLVEEADGWSLPPALVSDLHAQTEYNRLVSLIRAMPEQYRTVLELKLVAEWRNTEIAELLGITPNAVGARVARGRALLISKMEREGYTNE